MNLISTLQQTTFDTHTHIPVHIPNEEIEKTNQWEIINFQQR